MQKNNQNIKGNIGELYQYSKKYAPLGGNKIFRLKNLDRERVRELILTYILPLVSGLVNFTVGLAFADFPDRSLSYLMYVSISLPAAWFGGVVGGVITGIITVLGNLYTVGYLNGTGFDVYLSLQSFALGLCILLLSFVIQWAKKSNEIEILKEKERIYARTFREIYDEYTKALDEIKARDEFMTIASHELKTPLTSMLLKIGDMLNQIKNVSLASFSVPELMGVLQNAVDQVKWLSAMINDLLNVSLMTTGKMALSREKLDLVSLVEGVRESFSELIKKEKYVVQIEAETPVSGYWDKTRVEQAVTNLFSNAIKYGQNKPIKIKIINHGSSAKFIIEDHGIGISREDRKIIFKPFKRPKSVEGYKKGLGVGLYLTHLIAESHGGRISVKSTPMMGTIFTLDLPLIDKQV